MQLRRPTIALLALALLGAGAPAGHAQSASDLEKLIDEQAEQLLQGGDEPEVVDPAESGGVVGGEAPADDPLEEPDPADDPLADQTIDPAADAAEAGPTPAPPAYLVPGPGAGTRPVSAVASLTDPEVEAEPLRIAGLAGAGLAALALAIAAALRALGLREPLAAPATGVSAPSRLRRVSERTTLLADDMRDFLRRRR